MDRATGTLGGRFRIEEVLTARIAGYHVDCTAPAEAFGSQEGLARIAPILMRVVVLSAATGELVWDHTNAMFWQMRGWELRGWLCEAIRYAQHFSVILLVQQLLLCHGLYRGIC